MAFNPNDPFRDGSAIIPVKRRSKKGWYVLKRGTKRWIGYAWDKFQGKYQGKTFPSEREANEWAHQRHSEFQTGITKAGKTLIQSVADEYDADMQLKGATHAHREFTKYVVRCSIAAGLTDINAEDCVEKARKMLLGLTHYGQGKIPATAKTRNNFIKILRRLGSFALRSRYVTFNPFLQLDRLPVKVPLKSVFTLEELGRLVDPRNATHPFYRAFAALIYTGFRSGEVRYLSWDWLHWDAMRIAMKIDHLTPKGSHERRARITCFQDEFAELVRPSAQLQGLMFPDLRYLDSATFQHRFESFLAHCGVELLAEGAEKKRTPHSTRHTWTCLMLATGENSILVQHYAGHTEQEMTAHYARQQEMYRRQVEKAGWKRGELRLHDFIPKQQAAPLVQPATGTGE